MTSISTVHPLLKEFQQAVTPMLARVQRPAEGALHHDYLVPGGPYAEQWDWDAFFIGMALTSRDKADAIYLRNWALNYIENAHDDGFCPGLLTPAGPDTRLKHMKPFIAQGAFLSSRALGGAEWLADDILYDRFLRIVRYREEHGLFHRDFGVFAWSDSMESGADNNLALLHHPQGVVAAVDCSCFVMREYIAAAAVGKMLGRQEDATVFSKRAEEIRAAVLQRLWSEEHAAFLNIDTRDGSFIPVVGYSSIHPFWAGIAAQEHADAFFHRWLLNDAELRSPYGFRTHAKSQPGYNNANIIKPHSNWQGPIWPIAMYLTCHALQRYGYADEARWGAERTLELCLRDIRSSGGMHENYDAETGEPLAAPNFISWNLLHMNLLDELEAGRDPFALPA